MNIAHQLVLINCAGTKMGRSLALHFASLNAKVLLCDTDENNLTSALSQCNTITNQHHAYLVEDFSKESLTDLYQQIHDTHQEIPSIILNVLTPEPDGSETELTPLISVHNSFSEFNDVIHNLMQTSVQTLSQHYQQGVIINLVENLDEDNFEQAIHCTTAIKGLTKTWSAKLAKHNIRIGAVIPFEERFQQSDDIKQVEHEMIRSAEYIIINDTFTGRTLKT